MLPKARRIPRELITKALLESKRYNSPNLLLSIARNPVGANTASRFSFSVSKKVCKRATDRNKFRRRGYSAAAKQIKNIKPGFLCIFSFKKGSAKITFAQMEKEISSLLADALVLE